MSSLNMVGKTPAEVLGDEADTFLEARDKLVNWERRKTLVCFFHLSPMLGPNGSRQYKDEIQNSAMVRALGMPEIIRLITLQL